VCYEIVTISVSLSMLVALHSLRKGPLCCLSDEVKSGI